MSARHVIDAVAQQEAAHPALVTGRLFPGHGPAGRPEAARAAFTSAGRLRAPVIQAAHERARRLLAAAATLVAKGTPVTAFHGTTLTRMITGAGAGLPEVNATQVDPVLGCPWLSGSGLKGAARAWSANVGRDPAEVIRLFGGQPGSPGEVGGLRFLDAFPSPVGQGSLLELDVATVHYPDYYKGHALTRSESPIPLPLLVVPAGTRFLFLVMATRGHAALLGPGREALQRALVQDGVGASTSSGYGYFTEQFTPATIAPP